MKKKKLIIIFLVILLISLSIFIGIKILNDKQRLSVNEKQWLNANKNNVISVNVINDLNVFGKEGKGLFYDFLNSLSENYNIEINPVTFNSQNKATGAFLGYSLTEKNFQSFFDDEFVVVNKSEKIIKSLDDIKNYKIGITEEFKNYIEKYLSDESNEYVLYKTKEELIKAYKENNELNFIIVPKIMYLDEILTNNFNIIYHISDAKIYYGINNDQTELANILAKYFESWKVKNYENSLNENELLLIQNNLNISDADIDKIKSKNYTYGFIDNGPYEIISGSSFGGINAIYMKKFADLLDVKIDFVKYNNLEKLSKAIYNNKVNIYFDYYNTNSSYESISSNNNVVLAIIASTSDNTVINSLNSLEDKEIYAEENTKLYKYLKDNAKLNVKTYKNKKELKKIIKTKKIIAMDLNRYESYKDNILKKYVIRYTQTLDLTYKYRVKTDNNFNKILNKYLEILDNNQVRYSGLNSYFITKQSGTFLGAIAKYILLLFAIFIIVFYFLYKKSKKIKIAKKIKKEDKMRFIDQLTSLKNRNYLNENLDNWNNNTIYPQAVIVLDLNKLQEINDTLGYEKGDIQIKACANILIKTQLDNSDIIRTDGNEFLIYLVGHEVKQITSYIHKLNKEFKKLPYDNGVSIGYSMITDDVKSVEDATNEAVEQVKNQKEEKKDE